MERFVIEYCVGSPYSFITTETRPIEWESLESFKAEFIESAKHAFYNNDNTFSVGYYEFNLEDFFEIMPPYSKRDDLHFDKYQKIATTEFLSMDEWFNKHQPIPGYQI